MQVKLHAVVPMKVFLSSCNLLITVWLWAFQKFRTIGKYNKIRGEALKIECIFIVVFVC